MNKTILTAVVVAVVVGGVGFWSGMNYAQSQTPARGQFAGGGNFSGRANGGAGARGGGVFGTIIAKDATSITVQLMGGPNATSTGQTGTGSRIVLFDSSTQIAKTVSGSASDLTTGENVTVAGTTNSDGSVSAQSIQIRPAGIGGRGGGQVNGQ